MELLTQAFEVVGQLDRHLLAVVQDYGSWAYLLLFTIVFCETGLVVTPFLPGDSLLFAAGAVAAVGSFDVLSLALLLTLAAVTGDAVNYALGSTVASRFFLRSRLLDGRRLAEAERFYRRHGGKTIVIARFAPFLRTFAPFLAGMARMPYPRFATYNLVGGAAWVALCTLGGFFFGNVPVVQENFSAVLLGIVTISLVPVFTTFGRRRDGQTSASEPTP
jgi:membrane-associated protein